MSYIYLFIVLIQNKETQKYGLPLPYKIAHFIRRYVAEKRVKPVCSTTLLAAGLHRLCCVSYEADDRE